MSLKHRQMAVSNKLNEIEENGSKRVVLARATERPTGMITQGTIR